MYLSFVQCRPGLLRDLYLAVISEDAPRDQGDQGLPPEGEEEGRQERQDKEERRQCQVQGLLCHEMSNWLFIPSMTLRFGARGSCTPSRSPTRRRPRS